tara:strand:- start:5306 stop:5584 length:279 start_codon:yes stop_codon:yes gene_type:complete
MSLLMFKFLFIISLITSISPLKANYWLVIGTYRQGPSGRPEVSGITSPSLYSLPMRDLETCMKAGAKITDEIYKPVWQFDSQWTCIFSGKNN